MDRKDFLTYQTFSNEDDAKALVALLEDHNITCVLKDTSVAFDQTFSNNDLNKVFDVKLKRSDFEIADKLQFEESASQLNNIGSDYYLFEFSNEELKEVLMKNDEWSKLDYLLAQKILRERGLEVSKEYLHALNEQRATELAKPEESEKVWIIAGYVFAALGGLLGIFIGFHLLTHKKTLRNGERVYTYSTSDRRHGSRILTTAVIFFIGWLLFKFLILK